MAHTDEFYKSIVSLIDRFGVERVIHASERIRSRNKRWKHAIVSTKQEDFRYHKNAKARLCKPYKGYWITSDYDPKRQKSILERLRVELSIINQ